MKWAAVISINHFRALVNLLITLNFAHVYGYANLPRDSGATTLRRKNQDLSITAGFRCTGNALASVA